MFSVLPSCCSLDVNNNNNSRMKQRKLTFSTASTYQTAHDEITKLRKSYKRSFDFLKEFLHF